MARIPLTQGYEALVDDEDVVWLSAYTWRVTRRGRCLLARTWGPRSKGRRETIYMQRLIFGAGPGDIVDHANGDGLDNRRCNLRLATPVQDAANRVRRGAGFKGVSWDRWAKKWHVRVGARENRINCGRYDDEEEAARAYDAAAAARYGEFAKLNFPRQVPA